MGSDKFVISLSMETRSMLYGSLTADCLDLDKLTSHCMLLLIFPASSLEDDFSICIMDHTFGGSIGSVAVN